MRDIRAARRKFWFGLLAFVSAGLTAYLFLIPSYKSYTKLQSGNLAQTLITDPGFSTYVRLPVPVKNSWQASILSKWYEYAQARKCVITAILADPEHPQPVSGAPDTLGKIPFELNLEGTFSGIRIFINDLTAKQPGLRLSSVSLKYAEPTGSLPANESPLIEARLSGELLIVLPKL